MKILTQCAACAAPLSLDAPRCVRCHTRYCNQTCQHDHWRRGHKQMCKKIHRGGNAEQYHADKKYKEAVAEAVEACADDTKGHGDCIISDETNLSHDDLLEARVTLEEGFRRSRRVLGPQHPITLSLEGRLDWAREKLRIAQH